MSAIAFLAGMGAGINHKERQDKEDARIAAKDKREQDLFDAQMADRAQVASDRSALREAGAPIPVAEEGGLPESMDNRDVGQAGEAPLAPQSYRVGANTFASRGLAEADGQKQVRSRVAATMAAQGNVLGADQLRTSGIAGEAAQLALDEHKITAIKKSFDEGLNAAAMKGVEALIEYTNSSGASPNKSRLDNKVGPDGKREVIDISPDGTERPTGMRYTPDAAGARNMALDLSKLVPTEAKIKHYQAEEETKRKAAHDDGMLKIAKQNADTQEQYRKDQAAHLQRNDARQAAHDAAALKNMATPAGVKWGKESDDFLKKMNTTKGEDGNETVDGGGMVFQKQLALAQASRNGGDETSALGYAFQIDNKIKADAKGNPEAIRVARLELLQKLMAPKPPTPAPGAAPVPAAPPMANPAAVARQGVAAPDAQIPSPPPEVRQVGLSTQPNPAFVKWNQRFGDAWRAQQAAQSSAQDAAAAAAKSSFNPYAQNRVN